MKYNIILSIEKSEDCFLIHSEQLDIWSAGVDIPDAFSNFSKDLKYISLFREVLGSDKITKWLETTKEEQDEIWEEFYQDAVSWSIDYEDGTFNRANFDMCKDDYIILRKPKEEIINNKGLMSTLDTTKAPFVNGLDSKDFDEHIKKLKADYKLNNKTK